MKIHHLTCGTMRPFGGSVIDGSGHPFKNATMVAHCLLVETPADGLVIVDSGFGVAAVERPASLGRAFLAMVRPSLRPEESAVRQVAALGHDPSDVRHVVLTHLDLDHAGGLADFPQATVHVHEPEFKAATAPASYAERARYLQHQWAHEPDWATYSADGEAWFGFEAVRALRGLPEDILLIPLPGHTRGHSGVAVRDGDRWLLHAGDAYFFRGEVDPAAPHCTPGLRMFQNIVQVDGRNRVRNRDRLQRLAADHSGEVDIVSAHDPVELARHQA